MVYDKQGFKYVEKLFDYKVGPTKFIQINKVIRFNNEKVAFINAKKFCDDKWYNTTEGARVPPDKIKNVTDALEEIKKEHDEGNDLNHINEKFKNKHRFSVGPNSDLVIDMFKDKITEEDRIFMRYQPELGKDWRNGARESKGVTIPLKFIPEIIDGLTKTIKKL